MALKASVSFAPPSSSSSSSSPYGAPPSRRVLLATRMLRNSFLNGGGAIVNQKHLPCFYLEFFCGISDILNSLLVYLRMIHDDIHGI